MADPQIDLYSGSTVIATNDDWGIATNAAAVQATGMAPTDALESAILITSLANPCTSESRPQQRNARRHLAHLARTRRRPETCPAVPPIARPMGEVMDSAPACHLCQT